MATYGDRTSGPTAAGRSAAQAVRLLERRRTLGVVLAVVGVIGVTDVVLLAGADRGTGSPVAMDGRRDGDAPPRPSADGRLLGPRVVAPGGRVRIFAHGVPVPARVQELVAGRWVARGEPIATDGGSTRFRIRAGVGRAPLRAVGSDGRPTGRLDVPVRALRLAAVGDINLSPAPLGAVAGDVAAPWRSVGARLRDADLAFGNLETAVSTRGTAEAKQFTFRSTPAALRAMRRHAGIDVVNLANNHTGDYGRQATTDTLRHVARNGIVAVGAGRDHAAAHRPRIVRRLGLKIAFVGFSTVEPADFGAGPDRPGVAWATPRAVREAVSRAEARADVVIATFHWGVELAPRPTDQAATLAREALRSGATAVVGAHPHVLQPTIRVGRDRLIAYSLGNFVFPARSPATASTGILQLRLGAGRVLSHAFFPATIRGATPVLTGGRPLATTPITVDPRSGTAPPAGAAPTSGPGGAPAPTGTGISPASRATGAPVRGRSSSAGPAPGGGTPGRDAVEPLAPVVPDGPAPGGP